MSGTTPTQVPSRLDPELPPVLIALLKGVIYREIDPRPWSTLLRLHAEATGFLSSLNLLLQIDEAEGYAFVRSPTAEQAEDEGEMPRLVPRRQLAYHDSLLLALLRKKLTEFDVSGTEIRLVLTLDQLLELATLFLPEHTDEIKLRERISTSVQRLQDLGFLRKLKSSGNSEAFEVLRIIKAFIDAQWLGGLESGLASYRQHASERQTT